MSEPSCVSWGIWRLCWRSYIVCNWKSSHWNELASVAWDHQLVRMSSHIGCNWTAFLRNVSACGTWGEQLLRSSTGTRCNCGVWLRPVKICRVILPLHFTLQTYVDDGVICKVWITGSSRGQEWNMIGKWKLSYGKEGNSYAGGLICLFLRDWRPRSDFI